MSGPRPGLASLSSVRNPAVLVEAKHGAVASENEVCSRIGVDVMKDGGNAVDAAVGTVLCIGVVNMFSSGIGGGGFMTVRLPPSAAGGESEVWEVDFRETAPALANSTMYVGDPTKAQFGGLAVAVPGELRGLGEAHQRWGKLEWSRLVQPSVELAAGFRIGRELGRRINLPLFAPLMLGSKDWRDIFAPEGAILTEGDILRRTNLSRTLATIAEHGPEAFYHGEIAEAIVDKVRAEGGILTMEDLANYKVNVTKALTGTYRDWKVYVPHAPTSGPVLLHMLNLIEYYNLSGEGQTGLNLHRLIEAMKFGFAARTKITDPAFNEDSHRINEISEKSFANYIVKNLTDDRTHPPAYYNPIFDTPEDHGTSHSSVVDKDGMAVSITTTINFVFGSLVLDSITGVILNDEMDDFSVPGMPNGFGLWPSPYNYPEPGKRSLSSTVPLIIENAAGELELVLGGSGGSRIFPAVFQVLLNLEWGYDISAAIEAPRVHNQLYPLFVDADDTYPSDLLDGLRTRGHNVTVQPIDRIAAVVNGVTKKNGRLWAASDSRKNGIAAGY
ncbi:gamma-glutamyltranspeptidase [Vararia minispora EC-137]|uniref:Gamma-glutamyltranspeptidase n=1 Tax=Vararia minispora EC-137 TaxID=1314806 RepID=A0ACB8QH27_9AGAM|nr:gamma-glutamyltranspeptidase [Vararia minispora EC-137]